MMLKAKSFLIVNRSREKIKNSSKWVLKSIIYVAIPYYYLSFMVSNKCTIYNYEHFLKTTVPSSFKLFGLYKIV